MATPTVMATEMETTVAVPAVLAVRVEVRVPAARTAAPYTSLPRHLPSTAMCLCVQLQDSHEQPSRRDPKYRDQARKNLLTKFMSGQQITYRMLRKEMQRCFRVDYKRWHKQHIRAKTRRARDEAEATRLAELGLGPLGTLVAHHAHAREAHTQRARTHAHAQRARTHAHAHAPGARAHARLTRATRTHTRAHTHTRARATSVDPRLRPCGADSNSESSSSPPPALLSPQARSSPPPALSPPPELSPFPLSSLMLLAEWTPERSLSTSTVRTELM